MPKGSPKLIDRDVVVRRALAEVERLGWDSYFVAGDAWGSATAAMVAAANPEPVRGLALGHATLHFDTEGARPAVNGQVVAAIDAAAPDGPQLVRALRAHTVHPGRVRPGDRRPEMVRRFPATEVVSRVWEMHVEQAEPIGDLLRQLDKPLLIAKHEGCLVFTAEGYEDLFGSFPGLTDGHRSQAVECER